MCLSIVTSTSREEVNGAAFKVLQCYVGAASEDFKQSYELPAPAIGQLRTPYQEKNVPLGGWEDEPKRRQGKELISNWPNSTLYSAGYHLYEYREDAETAVGCTPDEEPWGWMNVVARVNYRTVLSRGLQNGLDCLVVEEMRVDEILTPLPEGIQPLEAADVPG